MPTPTRQRLLDAAFELFSAHGFHAIGLDRVLSDAGVSKQTFYNHFESRDALILEVIRQRHEYEFESFCRFLRERGGKDPESQLACLFEALDHWFKHEGYRGCIFMTAAAEFPNRNDPIHRAAAEHIHAIREELRRIARLAGARDAEGLADQLILLLEGAVLLRQATGNDNAALLADRTSVILLREHLPAALEECGGPPEASQAAAGSNGGPSELS